MKILWLVAEISNIDEIVNATSKAINTTLNQNGWTMHIVSMWWNAGLQNYGAEKGYTAVRALWSKNGLDLCPKCLGCIQHSDTKRVQVLLYENPKSCSEIVWTNYTCKSFEGHSEGCDLDLMPVYKSSIHHVRVMNFVKLINAHPKKLRNRQNFSHHTAVWPSCWIEQDLSHTLYVV